MFSELAKGPPAEAGWPWHQCPYCEPSESSEDSRGERGGLRPCRGSCAAGDHGVGEAGSALCSVPCLEALPVSGEGPGFPTVAPGCSHTSDMWGPSAPCGYRHPSPGDITQPLVTTCEAVLCRGGCCRVGKVPGTARGPHLPLPTAGSHPGVSRNWVPNSDVSVSSRHHPSGTSESPHLPHPCLTSTLHREQGPVGCLGHRFHSLPCRPCSSAA